MAAGCTATSRLALTATIGLLLLGHRDVSGQQGVLRGVVADSAGAPIGAADVAIVALHRLTRTDDRGRFVLDALPMEDVEVTVRRLGYAPGKLRVKIKSVGDSIRVTLTELPELLQGMTATQQRARLEIEQFYRRRARGPGTFFTRDEIEDRHAIAMSDMLRMAPGVQVVRLAAGNGIRFTSGSARRGCAPLVWIDGQKAPGMEVDQIPLSDVEGIELYQGASTTPAQFFQNTATTCGTIVVWTRLPGI
jgi:outer membrane receptor for ferrienterochelin and colicins